MRNISALCGVWVVSLIVCPGRGACDESSVAPAGPAEVRATVEKSLQYLEKAGVAWIDNRKCVSCHRVAFLTWSFDQAGRRGFEVDREKLNGWIDWSVQKSLEKPEKGGDVDAAKNVDGVAQMILGRGTAFDDERRQKDLKAFAEILVAKQQQDGSWAPAGQLPGQKRPKQETTQVTTMWIALALGSLNEPGDAVKESRVRALLWLKDAQPGKSAEWLAAWLLLKRQEKNEGAVAAAIEQLRAQQHEDGGWGWLAGDPSDAIATGQSLYALRLAGVPTDDPALQKAGRFLMSTQQKDGSWSVKGTKEAKKNNVEETASYWGAGWATLGLLETLP